MFKRPVPKRSAIIIVALAFSIIYSVSIVACIFLKKHNFDIFTNNGNSTYHESASNTSYVSSLPSQSEINSSENVTIDSSSSGSTSSTENSSLESSSSITSSTTSSTASSTSSSSSSTPTPTPTPPPVVENEKFSSAIWISIYDLSDEGLKGKNKTQFTQMIDRMFDNAKSIGITSVICQVRPFSDALYKSNYFPYSSYLTGTQGNDPGYDPLKIMVESAHKKGLQIHAWLNPYRISSTSSDLSLLANSNPAKKWLTDSNSNNDRYVIASGNGLYYNPAYNEVQQLIVNGIKEICENYSVDGIHIDDYFYPTTETSFDDIEYNLYKLNTGSKALSLADWRRDNVNQLVSKIYTAVHSYSGLVFGISPAGNIDNNYNMLYADVEKWMSTPGYIDYITPQIYFGYNYPTAKYNYTNLLNRWMGLSKHSKLKIYIGLANYKIDTYDAGSDEWIKNNDIISKQTNDAYSKKADGVVLFSYGSVFGTSQNQIKQTAKFKEVFKSINEE